MSTRHREERKNIPFSPSQRIISFWRRLYFCCCLRRRHCRRRFPCTSRSHLWNRIYFSAADVSGMRMMPESVLFVDYRPSIAPMFGRRNSNTIETIAKLPWELLNVQPERSSVDCSFVSNDIHFNSRQTQTAFEIANENTIESDPSSSTDSFQLAFCLFQKKWAKGKNQRIFQTEQNNKFEDYCRWRVRRTRTISKSFQRSTALRECENASNKKFRNERENETNEANEGMKKKPELCLTRSNTKMKSK